jgi:hypothetical protein
MSIFAKTFGFLTGSGDAAEKTLEIGGSLIDNAFYTDQEKASNNNKMLDWYLKYQQATAGQNVSRRIISFTITMMWAFLVLLAVAARGFETVHGDDSFSGFVFGVLKDNVNTPFEIIIGFYFLTHVVKGIKNG